MSSIGQITVAHDDLMNHNPSRMTESSPAWPWTLWSFMSYNTLYTISWRVDLETFSSWWFCWYQSNKILNYQNLDSFQRLQPPVVISIALIDFEYISILNHELWGISITWNFQTHYFIGNLNLGRTRGKVMQITCRENREQQLVINRPIGISLNYIRSRITFVETEKLATSMFVYEVMPSVWIMDIFWLHNPRFINIRGIIIIWTRSSLLSEKQDKVPSIGTDMQRAEKHARVRTKIDRHYSMLHVIRELVPLSLDFLQTH